MLAWTWWPTTSELLLQAGLEPGMHCLDVGCGGGEVSLELAGLVGSAGHVTGIDMDEIKLGLAREAAARRAIGNVDFRVADVSDWRETTTYDLVYCRFLLQHLRRPLDLLANLWTAVVLAAR